MVPCCLQPDMREVVRVRSALLQAGSSQLNLDFKEQVIGGWAWSATCSATGFPSMRSMHPSQGQLGQSGAPPSMRAAGLLYSEVLNLT